MTSLTSIPHGAAGGSGTGEERVSIFHTVTVARQTCHFLFLQALSNHVDLPLRGVSSSHWPGGAWEGPVSRALYHSFIALLSCCGVGWQWLRSGDFSGKLLGLGRTLSLDITPGKGDKTGHSTETARHLPPSLSSPGMPHGETHCCPDAQVHIHTVGLP